MAEIEVTCVLCGTKVSVPITDEAEQDSVETASQQALELHLYHRTNHHPKEDRDADPAPASA